VNGGYEFREVLAGAKLGESWAVSLLFRDLQPRLLRFLRAQEPRAADDLASDAWLNIAKGLGKFEGDEAQFKSWVFTIARRRLADHRRRSFRRKTDVADDGSFELLEAPDAPDSEAIARLSGQEAVDLITATLSDEQAEVVLLRVVADLEVAQVAEIMGRPENWVRVTQHRALRKLAERLGPKLGVTQ
jgi:RNA polymerase sigma-70 factor, ECF subfamily